MFDRCRRWRKQMSRHADGTLPMAHWGALERHLSRCLRCRAAAEADRALRDVLGMHTGLLNDEAAEHFDNRVVAAVQSPARPAFAACAPQAAPSSARRFRTFPSAFYVQIAGGALVAGAVMALCFHSALRPIASSPTNRGLTSQIQMLRVRNELPVPLDSLLRSPTPRAALLWTTPDAPKSDRVTPAANTPPPADSKVKDKRSELTRDLITG